VYTRRSWALSVYRSHATRRAPNSALNSSNFPVNDLVVPAGQRQIQALCAELLTLATAKNQPATKPVITEPAALRPAR
jgi:hypothetical protein